MLSTCELLSLPLSGKILGERERKSERERARERERERQISNNKEMCRRDCKYKIGYVQKKLI